MAAVKQMLVTGRDLYIEDMMGKGFEQDIAESFFDNLNQEEQEAVIRCYL